MQNYVSVMKNVLFSPKSFFPSFKYGAAQQSIGKSVALIAVMSLIGGAVLRVGDMIYDGSIANQLQNLRRKVSDRSAHEIQSRRNRFRNSSGH